MCVLKSIRLPPLEPIGLTPLKSPVDLRGEYHPGDVTLISLALIPICELSCLKS